MRYFLELTYSGTNYRGWQRQRNAPTVQQTLEDALGRLLGMGSQSGSGSGSPSGRPIEVTGAGRTDTGVHAAFYVAHFDLPAAGAGVAEAAALGENFIYHLNAILPPDIAVRAVRPVADDAHARFDAIEREYTYYITPRKDPFGAASAWYYSVPLDVEAMNRAADILLTVNDFTTFAKLGGGNRTNICRVTRARWSHEGEKLVFQIRADRFLRNMVRAIVGTLVDVGRGKITPERFGEIVRARDLSLASGGAPAHGLFLTDIKY